ncbi:glycoside hydrolase family 113 [Marisediminicola senii]|uniref:glycoside hydrolase family 113 n=1 Tax=Marisediminicola senii TaxID=2711233 RepID=UPI001F31666F|nr:1,4-beta-xylanase [Marisediminicola senii]
MSVRDTSPAAGAAQALFGGHFSGMTWGWTGVRGTWATAEATHSLDELSRTNINWVVIAYAAQQANAQETVVEWREAPAPTDDEIRWAINASRERGYKVCLKPTVNCKDGTWRGYIGFFDWDVPGEATWGEWFNSYTQYMVHMATLAEEMSVDLFCIGCEMVRADSRENEWRELIRQVRAVYSGPITYNCDKYQEDHLTWWDAVDVISASGYYPTGSWQTQLDRIAPVVAKYDKPFLFIEAGCPSRDTSPAKPNDWTLAGKVSVEAQADYLAEMFEENSSRDWVAGFALWDWPAKLYSPTEADQNDDYCMYAKPGEKVVARYYGRRNAEQVSVGEGRPE